MNLEIIIFVVALIIISYLIIVKLSAKLTGRKESELTKLFVTAIAVIIIIIIFLLLSMKLGLIV